MTQPLQLLNGDKPTGIWRFPAKDPAVYKYVLPTDTIIHGRALELNTENYKNAGSVPVAMFERAGILAATFGSVAQADGKTYRDSLAVRFASPELKEKNTPAVESQLKMFVPAALDKKALSLVYPGRMIRESDILEHFNRLSAQHPGEGEETTLIRALIGVFNDFVAHRHDGHVTFEGYGLVGNMRTVVIGLQNACGSCELSSMSIERTLFEILKVFSGGKVDSLKVHKPVHPVATPARISAPV